MGSLTRPLARSLRGEHVAATFAAERNVAVHGVRVHHHAPTPPLPFSPPAWLQHDVSPSYGRGREPFMCTCVGVVMSSFAMQERDDPPSGV